MSDDSPTPYQEAADPDVVERHITLAETVVDCALRDARERGEVMIVLTTKEQFGICRSLMAVRKQRDKARAENRVLQGRIDRVKAMHVLVPHHDICDTCTTAYEAAMWPCATVRALTGGETP